MFYSHTPFLDGITQLWNPKVCQLFICEAVILESICGCLFRTVFVVLGPRKPNTAIMPVFGLYVSLSAYCVPFICVLRHSCFCVEHHCLINLIRQFVYTSRFSKMLVPFMLVFCCFILCLQQSSCDRRIVNIMCKDVIWTVELLLCSLGPRQQQPFDGINSGRMCLWCDLRTNTQLTRMALEVSHHHSYKLLQTKFRLLHRGK